MDRVLVHVDPEEESCGEVRYISDKTPWPKNSSLETIAQKCPM